MTLGTLLGSWRLLSLETRDENGIVHHPMGHEAVGELFYDPSGHMFVLIMQPDRPAFKDASMRHGTDAEVRAAFEGFLGYTGRYTVDEVRRSVTHHVRVASYPNWVGTEQVRFYEISEDRLTLSSPPTPVGEHVTVSTAIWERVPS